MKIGKQILNQKIKDIPTDLKIIEDWEEYFLGDDPKKHKDYKFNKGGF